MTARNYTQPISTIATTGGLSAAWLASLGLVGCSISDFSVEFELKKREIELWEICEGDFLLKVVVVYESQWRWISYV